MISIWWIYLVGFVAFFVTVEWQKRKWAWQAEKTRKLVHVVSCLTICTMPWYISNETIYGLALAFVGLLAATRIFGGFSAVQGVKRKTIGEFTLPLGAILCAWVFLPENAVAFQVGFVVLAISDTLAEWVGGRWPILKVNLRYATKSLGGAIAFWISMTAVMLVFSHVLGISMNGWKLVIGCAMVAAMELSQGFGIDNLFIPVATGMAWEWVLD